MGFNCYFIYPDITTTAIVVVNQLIIFLDLIRLYKCIHLFLRYVSFSFSPLMSQELVFTQ